MPKGKPGGRRADSQLSKHMASNGYYLCSVVAHKAGVHRATVYRWVHDKLVKARQVNGTYYVQWASVQDLYEDVADVLDMDADPQPA